MKTLVVLSALAAVALAAPSILEEGSEDFKKIATNIPGTLNRQKKSPLDSSLQENQISGAPANLPTTSQISEFGVSGRSFGLKKPIIIKKKPVGYQVYRDSDEEQAESGETCGKQVKVKFCDSKLEKMKSSNIEDTKVTEEDMKNSIKLAKEAVETLQRDLQIVEQQPGTQAGLWNHGQSESDVELHQDIEVTREALEHIHKNFGNLESMSLHATTLKEADGFDDDQFTMGKTEEQRLAQWKDAINAIQKNVEIARNIEESFKSTSGENEMLFADDTVTNDRKDELNKGVEHLRTTKDMMTKDQNKADSENCKIHTREKSSDKTNAEQLLADDIMTMSASSTSEKKVKDIHNPETTRHAQLTDTTIGESTNIDKSLEHRDADLNSMNWQDLHQKESETDSKKSIEDVKDRKTETEEEVKPPANDAASIIKADDKLIEQHMGPMNENISGNDKSKVKSAEHFDKQSSLNKKDNKHHKDLTEQPKDVDTNILRKSAEEVLVNKHSPTNTKTQTITPQNRFEQPSLKMAKNEDLKKQSELIAPFNNAGLGQFHEQKQPLLHPDMRAVDSFEKQQMKEPTQTRWAHNKNFQMQTGSMKSADSIQAQSMDHIHTVQHPGHHHHLTHNVNSQFDTTSHTLQHSRFPENFMTQGKAADVDMQSYYMSMREGNMGPENQRFRWKPSHESLRSAYGAPTVSAAPSPSSGSAVGLFPNANVGNCGIPLLLSCNPSVTAGSLAKAHPAPYSAPAYRTEEEFNFHTKRDVKKTHENLSTLNRTPNANLKASTVLVAKQ